MRLNNNNNLHGAPHEDHTSEQTHLVRMAHARVPKEQGQQLGSILHVLLHHPTQSNTLMSELVCKVINWQ